MKLPRFVVRYQRKGGKVDFYFTIPAAQRPEGWPVAVRLPRDELRRTRDARGEELAAVVRDAADLNARLDAWRANKADDGYFTRGTLPFLMDRWRKSPAWARLKPKTQQFYEGGWTHIAKWSERNNHPHADAIAWPTIHRLVSVYGGRPGLQRQVINVLQRLMQIAHDEGLIAANPWEGQKKRRWQSKKARQEKQTISYQQMLALVDVCDRAGHPSMGTAVMIGFDLMQYPEDIIGMRFGAHYDARTGVFRFDRGKTGVPAETPASAALKARIGDPTGLYLVIFEATKRPYTRRHFSKVFRECVTGTDFGTFEFRWLRHSGVKECDDAQLDPRMIEAIGAWTPGAGQAVINSNYRQHNADLAAAGMAQRERFRAG